MGLSTSRVLNGNKMQHKHALLTDNDSLREHKELEIWDECELSRQSTEVKERYLCLSRKNVSESRLN